MAKKNFDQQLAALDALKNSPASPSTPEALRKALANPNNYIVAKASQIVAQLAFEYLVPDLLAALDRFFVHPAKSDPQCWAKNAIVQGLADLGHHDPAVFLRGLRHVQMEPVWGGQEDTAAALRSKCALALVECHDLSDLHVLSHLLELLVDADKTVRTEAARAVGRVNRREAALLLRLKVLTGDTEPEVLGACFTALLSIEVQEGIDFAGRFLEGRGDAAGEAALALGLTHDPRALALLRDRWNRGSEPDLSAVLLTAMALTRLPEAVDFLVGLIEADAAAAAAAINALAAARMPEEVRLRVDRALQSSGNPRLRATFEEHFG
jgi:hypothetical protein